MHATRHGDVSAAPLLEVRNLRIEFPTRRGTLVAVDGPERRAVFDTAAGQVSRRFDLLHVTPPQKGVEVVADSVLADAAGYVEVDPVTLRHKRFANVLALGDAGSMPNAKTAAAVRKQAPVAAVNALAILDRAEPGAAYDGYGSCPLTVENGKIVLAEFGYGGALKPSWYGDCLPERDFPLLIELYLQGRLDLDAFVSEVIPLDGVEGAFEKMHRGEVLRSVVKL